MPEIKIKYTNNRTPLHDLLIEAVYGNVIQWASNVRREWRLPNNTKADIIMNVEGYEIIIEVKSILKPSIMDQAIAKYYRYCEYLIIAAPPSQFYQPSLENKLHWTTPLQKKIGKLVIKKNGLELIKLPHLLHEEKARQS